MEMIVKGRRTDITPAIREYAEQKIGRVAKILDSMLMSAEVELYAERNRSIENSQVAEVTVYTKGPVIRAKEASSDLFAAIDLVSEKLESQVRKYKTKLVDHRRTEQLPEVVLEPQGQQHEPAIVKTKVLTPTPMTTDEAILQMELLGHDFFVFRSVDGDETCVLYRRHDGDYGLITSV